MDEIDDLVDANSPINVILPLDLTALFPSEEIFDFLYHYLRAYFVPSATSIPQLTQEFLFSICAILRYDATPKISHGRFLPSVLRCFNSWRLLSTGERLLDETIQALALGLAGIVDCRVSAANLKGPSRLRIRWVGADPEYADFQSQDPSSLKNKRIHQNPGDVVQKKTNSIPPNLSYVCPNTPVLETAKFRSGCCCCCQPRNSISVNASSISAQGAQTNIHTVTNTPHIIHDALQHPTSKSDILPRSPDSRNVNENIPALLAQSSSSRRSFSSRISIPASSQSRDTLKILPAKRTVLYEPSTPYSKSSSISSKNQKISLPVSKSQTQQLSRVKSSFLHINTSGSPFQANAHNAYACNSSNSSAFSVKASTHTKPISEFLPSTSVILVSSAITNSKTSSQSETRNTSRQSYPSMQSKTGKTITMKQKVVDEKRALSKRSPSTASRILSPRKDRF